MCILKSKSGILCIVYTLPSLYALPDLRSKKKNSLPPAAFCPFSHFIFIPFNYLQLVRVGHPPHPLLQRRRPGLHERSRCSRGGTACRAVPTCSSTSCIIDRQLLILIDSQQGAAQVRFSALPARRRREEAENVHWNTTNYHGPQGPLALINCSCT
jgi:hypothetical protein